MLSPESSVFLGGKGPEQLAAGTEQQGAAAPAAHAALRWALGCPGTAHPPPGSSCPHSFPLRRALHPPLLCVPAAAGQQGGRGGGGGPAISAQGRELLKELQQEGLGDHILLLRLYEASCGRRRRQACRDGRRWRGTSAAAPLAPAAPRSSGNPASQPRVRLSAWPVPHRCAPRLARPSRPPSPMQAWQAAGASIDWCRDLGVDGRSMRFARDIRQQLERIIGPDGSGFDGAAGRRRAERQRGGEGGEAGGAGEAARRDDQPAADGQQREGERERGGQADRDGGGKRERERHSDPRAGKRPRRSGGFSDVATVSALRMALTIGALRCAALRPAGKGGARGCPR